MRLRELIAMRELGKVDEKVFDAYAEALVQLSDDVRFTSA